MVLKSSQDVAATGVTNVVYQHVDITVNHDDDVDTDEVRVRARLNEATAFKHMNFGVWAALAEAKADGAHDPEALGIGFVNALATGDRMTPVDDMPNNATATYTGAWAGTVQAADGDGNGATTMQRSGADIEANFGMGDITVTLDTLATLTGAIDGNTFEGTEAEVMDMPLGNLTGGATVTGTFNGGFFGAEAAEAGGVFSFASKDNKNGAFTGAFGGDRDDN